jgi:hypothetical protein
MPCRTRNKRATRTYTASGWWRHGHGRPVCPEQPMVTEEPEVAGLRDRLVGWLEDVVGVGQAILRVGRRSPTRPRSSGGRRSWRPSDGPSAGSLCRRPRPPPPDRRPGRGDGRKTISEPGVGPPASAGGRAGDHAGGDPLLHHPVLLEEEAWPCWRSPPASSSWPCSTCPEPRRASWSSCGARSSRPAGRSPAR